MQEGSENYPREQDGNGGDNRERLLPNGFRLVEQETDFGRGKVNIIQLIPPTIAASDRISTRKQIFIPGYRPSWADQPKELKADLIMLAEINKELGRNIICVGVAFIGDRKHSGKLVSGLRPGIDITSSQYEKAQDFVESMNPLVVNNNAEVAAHSLGGTIALAANDLGLPVDTIGLFNSAGLYKQHKDELLLEGIPETIKTVAKASFTKVRNMLERRKEKRVPKLTGRTVLNRIHESRVNNYAAYRSLVHEYLSGITGKKVIIGSSEKDKLYPRMKVRGVLSSRRIIPNPDISLIDLSWDSHNLGRQNKPQRRQRLNEIAKVVLDASRRSSV